MGLKRIIKNSFLFKLLNKYHVRERIRLFRNRKKMDEFALKGESVIKNVHNVLMLSGNKFFVDAGTLMGIYRDGRLLKRDMDVDMGIVINDQDDVLRIRQLLIDSGFELKLVFSTPNNGYIQDAFDFDGIRVDMCYFKESSNNTYCYIIYDGDKIIKMSFSRIEKTRLLKFGDQLVSIPDNSEKYLEERYGETWRVPDPFFKYWEAPCVTHEDGLGLCEHIE